MFSNLLEQLRSRMLFIGLRRFWRRFRGFGGSLVIHSW
jgi:hypothetical protein